MPSPLTVVIFGASGDLTSRKLVPSLYNLFRKSHLPDGTRVLGVARSEYTDTSFRDHLGLRARDAFTSAGEAWDEVSWGRFASSIHYVPADVTTPDGLKAVQKWFEAQDGTAQGPRLYYLSVSPELYPELATALGEAGFNNESAGFRRLVIEKPFGHDLATARSLNTVLHQHWRENQLYRIDHYLGKETVQNILIFRFANTLFEPLWSYQYIDHVQITVAETVTVGRRGAYYDGSGVLRDMIQSHLLQVMALVAMESPGRYSADALRNEKMKVLEAIPVPSAEKARRLVTAAQYEGYRAEPGVPENSRTPTYAAVKLAVQNARWKNVPFYLRSGKGLKSRYSEVMIQFHCPPHLPFPLAPGQTLQCNRMKLILQPNEGILLNFQTKVPEVDGVSLEPRDLAFDFKKGFATNPIPEAYERLILDAIQGDAALFMRSDEIERAWEIMDPIVAATEASDAPEPQTYAQGSEGPSAANAALAAEGRAWQPLG